MAQCIGYVSVEVAGGDCEEIPIDDAMTVMDLKQQLVVEVGIPAVEQQLCLRGQAEPLANAKKVVADYGIDDGASLVLVRVGSSTAGQQPLPSVPVGGLGLPPVPHGPALPSVPTQQANSAEGAEPTGAKDAVPVTIHVYDVGQGQLRDVAVPNWAGIYHAGVEVYGREYGFGGPNPAVAEQNVAGATGVFINFPKKCASHTYKESVLMGSTCLNEDDVGELLDELCCEWLGSTYHLLNRNCCHFAEAMCVGLGVKGTLPPWINRAANVGATAATAARHMISDPVAAVGAATALAASHGVSLPPELGNTLEMLLGGAAQAFSGVAAQMSAEGGLVVAGGGLASAAGALLSAQTGPERREVRSLAAAGTNHARSTNTHVMLVAMARYCLCTCGRRCGVWRAKHKA